MRAQEARALAGPQQAGASTLGEAFPDCRGTLYDSAVSFRSFLYALARLLGDVSAVKRGTMGRRIGRRVAGKATGRAFRRLFR